MHRKNKTTSVRLLSHTNNPIETIFVQWAQSRTEDPVRDPSEIAALLRIIQARKKSGIVSDVDLRYEKDVYETFEKVVSMKIPLAETIDFVFLIEHCPIALREQIVRHRIGHRYGGQLGADIVPDLAESTFWSQTTRVLNLGTFATDGEYLLPESVRDSGPKAPSPECVACGGKGTYQEEHPHNGSLFNVTCQCWRYPEGTKTITVRNHTVSVEEFYHEQMGWIQSAYNRLIEAGVPVEDARNLLPMATQHRLTWKVNLAALLHVLGKRGCWIAQLGMWEPVIRGMVEELATKVHPAFRKMIDPPCFGNDGEFKACVFKLENENRVKGDDPYAPCPLYLGNHVVEAERAAIERGNNGGDPAWRLAIPSERSVNNWHGPDRAMTELTVRGKKYRDLWGRDEWTGKKLDVVA